MGLGEQNGNFLRYSGGSVGCGWFVVRRRLSADPFEYTTSWRHYIECMHLVWIAREVSPPKYAPPPGLSRDSELSSKLSRPVARRLGSGALRPLDGERRTQGRRSRIFSKPETRNYSRCNVRPWCMQPIGAKSGAKRCIDRAMESRKGPQKPASGGMGRFAILPPLVGFVVPRQIPASPERNETCNRSKCNEMINKTFQNVSSERFGAQAELGLHRWDSVKVLKRDERAGRDSRLRLA